MSLGVAVGSNAEDIHTCSKTLGADSCILACSTYCSSLSAVEGVDGSVDSLCTLGEDVVNTIRNLIEDNVLVYDNIVDRAIVADSHFEAFVGIEFTGTPLNGVATVYVAVFLRCFGDDIFHSA